MSRNALGVLAIFGLLFALSSTVAYQPAEPVRNHLPDPFAVGWILNDTNGDGVVDFIAGKVVVPEHPTAEENAAAADIAARLGFATTGFTPPVVISAADDRSDGGRIYIGSGSAPSRLAGAAGQLGAEAPGRGRRRLRAGRHT